MKKAIGDKYSGPLDRVAVTVNHPVEGRITVTLFNDKPKFTIYVSKYRRRFTLPIELPLKVFKPDGVIKSPFSTIDLYNWIKRFAWARPLMNDGLIGAGFSVLLEDEPAPALNAPPPPPGSISTFSPFGS